MSLGVNVIFLVNFIMDEKFVGILINRKFIFGEVFYMNFCDIIVY